MNIHITHRRERFVRTASNLFTLHPPPIPVLFHNRQWLSTEDCHLSTCAMVLRRAACYLSFCPSSLSGSSELIKSRKSERPSSSCSTSASSVEGAGSAVVLASSSSIDVPACSSTCGST